MTLGRALLLSGLCLILAFTTGMSGCKVQPSDNFLDLSVSRGDLYYWGDSAFTITSNDGHVLLIDPYDPTRTGLPQYNIAPNYVLMTSNDWDVSDTTHWWKNSPTVVRGVDDSDTVAAIDQDYGPFHVKTVGSLHGAANGVTPGGNAIFVITVDGFRVVHLGNLGQTTLDAGQLSAIGTPDFLLVPVGGANASINGQTACDIVDQIQPRYVLPMHYKIAGVSGELISTLDPIDSFVNCFPRDPVTYSGNGIAMNNASVVTQTTLLLLGYQP